MPDSFNLNVLYRLFLNFFFLPFLSSLSLEDFCFFDEELTSFLEATGLFGAFTLDVVLSLVATSALEGVLAFASTFAVFVALPLPAFALFAKLGASPVTTIMILSIHAHALDAALATPAFLLFNLKFFISCLLMTIP